MQQPSNALTNVDDLSPKTRQDLQLWGLSVVSAAEAEVYEPNRQAAPGVIVDLQRKAALKAYLVTEADKAIKEAVYRAREQKISWHTIGNALGITGEAARQRYADR